MKKNVLRNERGFTLIEIIAVLVILGILAAVAVPKYLDLQTEAKTKAAQGQVAEIKSTLNLAYARHFMKNSAAPASAALVITEAGWTSGTETSVGTAPDVWTFTVTGAANAATISVTKRGADTAYAASGTWNLP